MKRQRQDKRRRAYRLGHMAESFAALSLRLRGWRILERRFKASTGEVDLIAERGDVVSFVEVKARRTRTAALEAVTPTARNRIIRAAQIYLLHHPHLAAQTLRFDLVLVVPFRWPEHVPDAFRPDGLA